MKKIALLVVLLSFPAFKNVAQVKKGDFLFSGNLTFYSNSESSKIPYEATRRISEMYVGMGYKSAYFISSKTAWGMGLGYNYSLDSYNSKASVFSFGPLLRYYSVLGEKAAFFFEVGGNLGLGNTNKIYYDKIVKYRETGFSAGLAPGFAYALTKRMSLETYVGLLNYTYSVNVLKDSYNGRHELFQPEAKHIKNSFQISLHPGLFHFGVSFFLCKKTESGSN